MPKILLAQTQGPQCRREASCEKIIAVSFWFMSAKNTMLSIRLWDELLLDKQGQDLHGGGAVITDEFPGLVQNFASCPAH